METQTFPVIEETTSKVEKKHSKTDLVIRISWKLIVNICLITLGISLMFYFFSHYESFWLSAGIIVPVIVLAFRLLQVFVLKLIITITYLVMMLVTLLIWVIYKTLTGEIFEEGFISEPENDDPGFIYSSFFQYGLIFKMGINWM